MNTRRERIEAMLRDEPHDVFLRYSLAMEMVSDGQIEEAIAQFQQLTCESPPHVPAFFRCGQLLAECGKVEEARRFLREGIEAARAQQDLHAAAEMSEMLQALGELGEG
ncbi:MAG: hypothetical protein KatS3mg111_2220 [Pirellulaceae bacterium]|nr:MAG: hypothetical protein KatS3mg111_2220 [Pirellulaceae bacterium]